MVLLTGASGYVGGHLLRALERQGRRVRCLTRRPDALRGRVGRGMEVVEADLLDPRALGRVMQGVETAYYLVHSMATSADFERDDRTAARNFASAARAAGVRRVIYLGGLGDESEKLSPHLRSRHEVGEIIRAAGVPLIELRASIVIGPGSLSFEMIRALVEHLPIMVTPSWVSAQAQPICIEDLIGYLVHACDADPTGNPVYEIGGADRVSYGDLMREYARQRGLRRLMIPVPVLTPRLSSLWLALVTPLYARVGRTLIDSIRHPTVVRDRRALREFPIQPRGFREAIEWALASEDGQFAERGWLDALGPPASAGRRLGGTRIGRRWIDSRTRRIAADPSSAFKPIGRIGGATGWYGCGWLWRIRGWLDLLVGGVGMGRGRPPREELRVGDVVDGWRVEAYESDRRLRLAAEMRLPGRAWLELEVEPLAGGSLIRQTAVFDPAGIGGLLYWYATYPLHLLVFRRMLDGIARAVSSTAATPRAGSPALGRHGPESA